MSTVSARIAIALAVIVALSSCANTIRGVGRDVHETKHAVKNAAE